MGHTLRLTVLTLLSVASPTLAQEPARGDSTVYADAETEALIALARAKHQTRALELRGYTASIFTRAEGRIGASRFARGFSLFTYETAARIHWQQPGDVHIEVVGARSAAPRIPGLRRERWATWFTEVFSDELWFSPAAIGDEIQLVGLPDEEAIHPLARDGARFYRYAIKDSVRISFPGRTVRAVAIKVEPREYNQTVVREQVVHREIWIRPEGSTEGERVPITIPEVRRRRYAPTLVSGEMWIDADSLDVIRLTVTFVGERLGGDDPDSPELISLEADFEFGLFENRYWLPHRQVLASMWQFKYLPGAKLPATAVTTFSDYDVNPTAPLVIASPPATAIDGWRSGGWRCPEPWEFDHADDDDCAETGFTKHGTERDGTRWQITVPSMDSLTAYDFKAAFEHTVDMASDNVVAERVAKMAALSEALPDDAVNRRRFGVDWRQAAQTIRFNRVQGLSLGFGYEWRPGPAFTTVHMAGRFGFGDLRPLGELTWRRDAPAGRFELHGFRRMADVEPWTDGLTIGNSLKALFLGHDDADYYLALGGGLSYSWQMGFLRDIELFARFERQRSVIDEAGSTVNDLFFGSGAFQPNPPVRDGDYVRTGFIKRAFLGNHILSLATEGLLASDVYGGRAWSSLIAPSQLGRLLTTVRAKAGIVFGDTLPQLEFRLGGPETVRGYTYGTRTGRAFWSTQLDLEWEASQWWSPVLFGDVGGMSGSNDTFVGIGAGVSLLAGWVRLDFSKGVHPSSNPRFDLLAGIPVN